LQVLVNGGVYYLVDGSEPFDFVGMQPVKAVIVHSPKLDACKYFMKHEFGVHKVPWYMPPLDQEEIIDMLPIFPHVTKELVGFGLQTLAWSKARSLLYSIAALLLCRRWHASMCMAVLRGRYLTARLMTAGSR
jgi:hypothetical protein